ncbi:MAG TPA: DUF6325 family protein [Acidimicrobiales bacterium]
MTLGPVEYVVIGFADDKVSADIVPPLAELVRSGTIRIIDLVFVAKDADGNVTSFEYDGLDGATGEAFAGLEGDADGLFNDEDVAIVGAALEPGTAAALMLFEDLWATPFAQAIRAAGGRLVAGERIPPEIVDAAVSAMAS